MFKSGQVVELTVKERDINLNAKSEFKFFTLNGTIQRSAHYDPPETIRLFTADLRFPVSVIPAKNIVSVAGKSVNLTKTDSQTWDVKGSKGAHYTVTESAVIIPAIVLDSVSVSIASILTRLQND